MRFQIAVFVSLPVYSKLPHLLTLEIFASLRVYSAPSPSIWNSRVMIYNLIMFGKIIFVVTVNYDVIDI